MIKSILFLLTFVGLIFSYTQESLAWGLIHHVENDVHQIENDVHQIIQTVDQDVINPLENDVKEIIACEKPALQLISLFKQGTAGMCSAIGDATAAMQNCCNGSSPKQVITDVTSVVTFLGHMTLTQFSQIQTELSQACQIFNAGGIDFLKGYCQQTGNGSSPYNCGYAIGQLLPQMHNIVTDATSMNFSGTLSPTTCHSLETVLSNSSCCINNVQTLINLVNNFVSGTLNQAVQQQQQLCSGNGEVMSNLVAGLDGCS